jgi:hypothetical protein
MTAGKMNCSTECPLDGTPRATLRRLQVCQEAVQYSTVQNEYRTEQGMTEENRLRYCGQTDRIPQEKESLRTTQETEYGTEKITSLVYVV